jgi:hypothetical protein
VLKAAGPKKLPLYGATSAWTPSQRFAVSRAKIPRSVDIASVLIRTAAATSSLLNVSSSALVHGAFD